MGNLFSCGGRDTNTNQETPIDQVKVYTTKKDYDKEKIYDLHDFMHKSIM